MRYRQRYVDTWVTEESRETLLARSTVLSAMRRYLEDRGFVEVETPVLHSIAGGGTAKKFTTHFNALDTDFELRIASELYLKRLVVGGFTKVFEISRVVPQRRAVAASQPRVHDARAPRGLRRLRRHDEARSRSSSPTSRRRCAARPSSPTAAATLDLTPPWRRATMDELVEEATGVRVDINSPIEELRALADEHGVPDEPSWGPGKLLVEIYEKTAETTLWGPIFVTDHPKETSPLARDHRERARLHRALRADRRRARVGQRVHRAGRPGRAARHLRSAGAGQGGWRRRGDVGRRGLHPRPRVRACRPTAGSASASTVW